MTITYGKFEVSIALLAPATGHPARRCTALSCGREKRSRQESNNPQNSSGKQHIPSGGGTKSGTVGGDSATIHQAIDPGLLAMAKVWDTLPDSAKAEILALIQSATAKQDR